VPDYRRRAPTPLPHSGKGNHANMLTESIDGVIGVDAHRETRATVVTTIEANLTR